MEEINLKKLESHVKRVCKPNLNRGAKICKTCPFLHIVEQAIRQEGQDD